MTQVSLFFHGLWILCGVGAVVLPANPALRWPGLGSLGLGFAIGIATIRADRVPDPVWVGSIVALVAGLLLFRPRTGAIASGCGGALAALWGVLLHVQGAPIAIAVALAAAVPSLSAILAIWHRAFAPERLREEALLFVLVLGLAVAMAPAAAAGWQAAMALNLEQKNVASQAIPVWALATTVAATLLGGVYALWMHR